jgi:NTE family protein
MQLTQRSGDLTVVVIEGAVARGAYEAAVLTELLPQIVPDLRSTILLGTSAGGDQRHPLGAGSAVRTRARGRRRRGRRRMARHQAERRVLLESGRWAPIMGLAAKRTLAPRYFAPPRHGRADHAIGRQREQRCLGPVMGLGAVATLCPEDGSGGRSRLFFCGGPNLSVPTHAGPLDLVPADLRPEHLLASSAVPVLFPAESLGCSASTQDGRAARGGDPPPDRRPLHIEGERVSCARSAWRRGFEPS